MDSILLGRGMWQEQKLTHKISKTLNRLTAVLFAIVLTACVSSNPVDDLSKTLSGNSFKQDWYFGTDGNVYGLFRENAVFQGTWRVVGSENTKAVSVEGDWHFLWGYSRHSKQQSLLLEVERAYYPGTAYDPDKISTLLNATVSGDVLVFTNRNYNFEDVQGVYSEPYFPRVMFVEVPDDVERGFPRRSEYNAMAQKIQSAPAYKAPDPLTGGEVAVYTVLGSICILTALLLC